MTQMDERGDEPIHEDQLRAPAPGGFLSPPLAWNRRPSTPTTHGLANSATNKDR